MILKKDNNLTLGMSDKSFGQMILHYSKRAEDNRAKFFNLLNIDPKNIVSVKLVHSNKIFIAKNEDANNIIENFDGLATSHSDIGLSITIADCMPIFVYDIPNQVVGIAHAGWRGTFNNIAANLISKMVFDLGSDPENIKVYIGPHIQKCHFKVKNNIIEKFALYKNYIAEDKNQIFVNLSQIIKQQLLSANITSDNIQISEECTFCLSEKYFSFRRDKPQKPVGQIAFIYMT